MSTAAATDAAPAKPGKKKLILIVGVVLLVVVLGAVAALMLGKKKPADEEGEEAAPAAERPAKAAVKHDPKAVPTFVPLDPFTVNLADREADRYAQVGVTLEVDDPKVGEMIKAYMPAIRNNILLALSDKTAAQLMERDGKTKLAERMRRETARAMGYEVEEPDEEEEAAEDEKPKRKKKRKEQYLPITAVHFSNFIIQ